MPENERLQPSWVLHCGQPRPVTAVAPIHVAKTECAEATLTAGCEGGAQNTLSADPHKGSFGGCRPVSQTRTGARNPTAPDAGALAGFIGLSRLWIGGKTGSGLCRDGRPRDGRISSCKTLPATANLRTAKWSDQIGDAPEIRPTYLVRPLPRSQLVSSTGQADSDGSPSARPTPWGPFSKMWSSAGTLARRNAR